ncbi:MAG: ABC transporter permease [Pedosphaera sp.]|nr:ABC transporter permease [Pedosphaera sp.]
MFYTDIGDLLILFWKTIQQLPQAWRHRRKIFEQLFEIGNASLFMVGLLSFFIGGVLALQTGPVFKDRGVVSFVGGMVGLAMAKELGPVMIAIMIAGRVGSAMAAEIGSMLIYQEIDALKTMNINPIRFLVLPRFVAIAIAMPCLVVLATLVGWIGGAVVSVANSEIALSFDGYFNSLKDMVGPMDMLNGSIKTLVFSQIIVFVSCHQGLNTIGGPRGVGRSVTKAVVNSIILILIADYFLTRLMIKW